MRTQAAIEFIESLIKSGKASQVVNACLNGVCSVGTEQDIFCSTSTRNIIEALSKEESFKSLANGITHGARVAFRVHNVAFEHIVCALFLSGFLSGAQFALDGGKAEHTHTHEPPRPPTKDLVN